MKKESLAVIFLGLFVFLVSFLAFNFSKGRVVFFGKAENPGIFSATNSYLFGSPLLAKSGGEQIRITVFALDKSGRGVKGKPVSVECKDPVTCQTSNVTIRSVQAVTDNLGRAIFDISSASPGQFEIQAKVEGVAIPQTVTVSFQ